jgi:hypothetical protein
MVYGKLQNAYSQAPTLYQTPEPYLRAPAGQQKDRGPFRAPVRA